MFFLDWENIENLLGKHPELKEHLKQYDFQKIKADEDKAIDELDFEFFCKIRSILENVRKDIKTYQRKKGFTIFEAMTDKELSDFKKKEADGSPESEDDRPKMPEKEFDVNCLNLIIYGGQLMFESRFLAKHPLTKVVLAKRLQT